MKWSVLLLVVLGIAAAVCAAVIVVSFRLDDRLAPAAARRAPENVEVVVAARAMPGLTVVDAKSVAIKTVPKAQAPEKYISAPAAAVGRVLVVGVEEGQALTAACFAADGSKERLASAIPEGMRVVSVSLNEHAGLEGLLYPGCLVDVLGEFRIPSVGLGGSDAISCALLHGVEVWAVDNMTVVSGPSEETASSGTRAARPRSRVVTLLVTPAQAQKLQLAMGHGTLSLAQLNPFEPQSVPPRERATALADLSSHFKVVSQRPEPETRPSTPSVVIYNTWPSETTSPAPEAPTVTTTRPALPPPGPTEVELPVARRESVTVLRAGKPEKVYLSAEGTAEQPGARGRP